MTHRAALVGRPQQVDVGVCLEHGLSHRDGIVGDPARLVGHDLDTGQLAHFGQEPFLARRATLELVTVEDADLGLATQLLLDELDGGLACLLAEILVLGDQEGGGDALLTDTGVKADDGDAGFFGLLQCRHRAILGDGGDDDGIHTAGDIVVDHAAFFGQVVLGVAQDDLSASLVGSGLDAGLHRLHEGVALEHDPRDQQLAFLFRCCRGFLRRRCGLLRRRCGLLRCGRGPTCCEEHARRQEKDQEPVCVIASHFSSSSDRISCLGCRSPCADTAHLRLQLVCGVLSRPHLLSRFANMAKTFHLVVQSNFALLHSTPHLRT